MEDREAYLPVMEEKRRPLRVDDDGSAQAIIVDDRRDAIGRRLCPSRHVERVFIDEHGEFMLLLKIAGVFCGMTSRDRPTFIEVGMDHGRSQFTTK